ncbi:SRPBCC family protein [Ancylomarina euxinus]|uniref:SRPBCC family protein n=1 Tax=Ancylomarina euxinus TaxID=2283627 RepID=A0A425XXR1_9BACT|nr:SRPBCC family protein [Ancylomarina euxinus]MCZ4696016.1 SRPBCC family protein [Ancylomarina euxinus]MUP13955.1 SRPBCC family protein [Ancylomarina euxinus]RRG19511.1 SRPBCC family protein [Ancylomarina euxinus]
MGCYNSIVIEAPAEKVWDVLRNFHDLSWARNVVTKVEIVGDKPFFEVGAKRIVNGTFYETLLSFDNHAKKFSYSIDDGPGPASKDNLFGYVGELTVFSVTDNNSSFVLWKTTWELEKNEGVAQFLNPLYKALLQDLKTYII